MDPGTILAVVQLAGVVLGSLRQLAEDVKEASEQVSAIDLHVTQLRDALQQLDNLVKTHPAALGRSASAVQEAQRALQTLEKSLDEAFAAKRQKLGRRSIKWPFTKSKVTALTDRLEKSVRLVNLALGTDHVAITLRTKADVEGVEKTVKGASEKIDQVGRSLEEVSTGMKEAGTSLDHLDSSMDRAEQDRLVAKLHYTPDAAFNSFHGQHEPRCLDDTRTELLREIEDWSYTHEPPIFWLSGPAGSGKSTVARTLAEKLHQQGRLSASFFFSRGVGDLGNARAFVGTLARQLAASSAGVRNHICEVIRDNPTVGEQGLRIQWQELISAAVSKFGALHPPMNVVIDALDECESDQDVEAILRLFVDITSASAANIGIFVTSRPEIPIRHGFRDMPQILHRDLALQDISRATVDHDISVFLQHNLKQIGRLANLEEWPRDDAINALVKKADGLFVHAATVCRDLADPDWDPEERLTQFLIDNDTSLDHLYIQVLKRAFTKNKRAKDIDELTLRFRKVVGTIVVLFDVLSPSAISGLLGLRQLHIDACLNPLHSVLIVPKVQFQPVRLAHPSFRDFLLDRMRCGDDRIWVEEAMAHQEITIQCLKLLSEKLRKNICGLPTPSSTRDKIKAAHLEAALPSHLQYAARYWVDHLACLSFSDNAGLMSLFEIKVKEFLEVHFLHWLEAMSLIGQAVESVRLMANLRKLFPDVTGSAVGGLVYDFWRFITRNCSIIEYAPLQTYASALAFAPTKSQIRRLHGKEIPTWIKSIGGLPEQWESILQTLNSEKVVWLFRGIKFVFGTPYLAAAGRRSFVLWDITTGTLLAKTEFGKGFYLGFSYDGTRLMSLDSPGRLFYVWDTVNAILLHVIPLSGFYPAVLRYWELGDDFVLMSSGNATYAFLALTKRDPCIICALDLYTPGKHAELKATENLRDEVYTLFARDNELWIVTISLNVHVWTPQNGGVMTKGSMFSGYRAEDLYSLTFGANFAVAVTKSRKLLTWDLGNEEKIFSIDDVLDSEVFHVYLHTQKSKIMITSLLKDWSRIMYAWDIHTSRFHYLKDFAAVSDIAVSPDQELIAIEASRSIQILNSASADVQQTAWRQPQQPRGRILAVSTKTHKVALLEGNVIAITGIDLTGGTEIHALDAREMQNITFAPDGQHLVLVFRRRDIHRPFTEIWIYDLLVCTAKTIMIDSGPAYRAPTNLGFTLSQNSEWLLCYACPKRSVFTGSASSLNYQILGQWRLSETSLNQITPRTCQLRCHPKLSEDGVQLALWSTSDVLHIHELEREKPILELPCQHYAPGSVEFLPNGRHVALMRRNSEREATLIILEVASSQQIYQVSGVFLPYSLNDQFKYLQYRFLASDDENLAGIVIEGMYQLWETGVARTDKSVSIRLFKNTWETFHQDNVVVQPGAKLHGHILHFNHGCIPCLSDAPAGCWWYSEDHWIYLDRERIFYLPAEFLDRWRPFFFIEPSTFYFSNHGCTALASIELDTAHAFEELALLKTVDP